MADAQKNGASLLFVFCLLVIASFVNVVLNVLVYYCYCCMLSARCGDRIRIKYIFYGIGANEQTDGPVSPLDNFNSIG